MKMHKISFQMFILNIPSLNKNNENNPPQTKTENSKQSKESLGITFRSQFSTNYVIIVGLWVNHVSQ